MKKQELEGDLLWEQILKEVEREEKLKRELINAVKDGERCFNLLSLEQEGIVHPSSKKEGSLQFTYFDSKGAVGDLESSTIKELVNKIVELGFMLCTKENFQFTLLAR